MLPLKPPYNILHFINILPSQKIILWEIQTHFYINTPYFAYLQIWTFWPHEPKNLNFTNSFLEHYPQPKLNQNSPKILIDPHFDHQTAVHILLVKAACGWFDLAHIDLARFFQKLPNHMTHLKSPKRQEFWQKSNLNQSELNQSKPNQSQPNKSKPNQSNWNFLKSPRVPWSYFSCKWSICVGKNVLVWHILPGRPNQQKRTSLSEFAVVIETYLFGKKKVSNLFVKHHRNKQHKLVSTQPLRKFMSKWGDALNKSSDTNLERLNFLPCCTCHAFTFISSFRIISKYGPTKSVFRNRNIERTTPYLGCRKAQDFHTRWQSLIRVSTNMKLRLASKKHQVWGQISTGGSKIKRAEIHVQGVAFVWQLIHLLSVLLLVPWMISCWVVGVCPFTFVCPRYR